MDSSSESETEVNCSTSPPPPPELLEDLQDVVDIERNLSENSKLKYKVIYDNFISWTMEKQISSLSEDVLLTYFKELAKKYKPSTLWSTYSMLKSTLITRSNVYIQKYYKLLAFIRRASEGFKAKKTRVFSATDISNFLQNAPDDRYLLMKVVLILGVNGACRSQEIIDITIDNLEIHENLILVNIPDTKTKLRRTFVISERLSYNIIMKYKKLRPKFVKTKRLLLRYINRKCIRQVIGKNYVNTIPNKIAKFLDLPNPQEYTGHCFRKTASNLLAYSGADLATIQHRSGWKKNMVTTEYTNNPIDPRSAPTANQPPPIAPATAQSGTPSPESSADCQSPPISEDPEADYSRVKLLERKRVYSEEQDAAAAERHAATTERASERQAAAFEMLAVRLAAAAEQQAAALASMNHQLNEIRNILWRQ